MANHKVEQPLKAGPKFFYGYVVVVAAFSIITVVFGVYYAFGVFFKPLLTEFGWTRAMTAGATSLAWIMHGVLAIAMGRLTDRFGPRPVMTLCGLLLGAGYLLMSQVSSIWQLYLFYGLLVGAGMSGSFVPLMTTVARWFARGRGMMTGIVVAGIGIGQLVAPPVANRLISAHDWRMSYVILGSIVLVVVVLAAQFLKRDPTQVGQVPLGENKREVEFKPETQAFSLREAVSTRQFWFVSTMFFCFAFCASAVMVHIAPHATELGTSTTTAANILATVGGLSIIGRVVLGSAADRIGNRRVFIIGFILMSAALLWLIPAREVWILYLFATAFGFAYGGCAASESPIVAALFGLSSHGLILGVINLLFTMGAALGPLLAGHIFDVTSSYQGAFLVCTVIGVVGLIATVLLTPTRVAKGRIT